LIYPALAFAQDGAGAGGLTPILVNLSPFILILLIFYFLLIRPQQKKERERQQMLSRISKGDIVITSGGLIGLRQIFAEVATLGLSLRKSGAAQ
jgi:preprotein translocase subunit YajC